MARRPCNGHLKNGKPCGNNARKGGFVCNKHGGKAPQVQRKAQERLADLIDPDRAIRETTHVAYSRIRDLFDKEGNLLPMKDWPDHAAAAVKAIKVIKRNFVVGDNKQDDVVDVQLWDKPTAQRYILTHLGLLQERLEVTGSVDIVSRIQAGRQRVADAARK